jgi:uncharacterized phage protein (TIGR01671 family)
MLLFNDMSSREFKFRVWDLKNSKWIDNDVDFILTNDGGWYFLGGDKFTDNDVIQQYTGLKDKNSKEIYEGDIIVVDRINIPFEVKWIDATNTCCNNPSVVGFQVLEEPKECQIVGNIFENPELLNL